MTLRNIDTLYVNFCQPPDSDPLQSGSSFPKFYSLNAEVEPCTLNKKNVSQPEAINEIFSQQLLDQRLQLLYGQSGGQGHLGGEHGVFWYLEATGWSRGQAEPPSIELIHSRDSGGGKPACTETTSRTKDPVTSIKGESRQRDVFTAGLTFIWPGEGSPPCQKLA